MTFDKFLDLLSKGYTLEQLAQGTNVECCKNKVYEDEDLYEFLSDMDAKIKKFNEGTAIIKSNCNLYEVPYENRTNRFDYDLPDETVLYFDYKRISKQTERR